MKNYSNEINKAKELLQETDTIIVGIGSGMTASGGLCYTDSTLVQKWYPEYFTEGKQTIFDIMGGFWPNTITEQNATRFWGFWARHIWHIRYEPDVLPPYANLFSLIKDIDYFIVSTNVDGQLEKAGFLKDKIFAPQGDYALFQCVKHCYDTEKVHGDDCTAAKYIEEPKKLCDTFAERLVMLHAENFSDCPIKNHTERYLTKAKQNKIADTFDKSHFPDSFGYSSAKQAWEVVQKHGHLLKADTLLHGDYCLPNVILNDWRFSGFIDLDNSGVGDRHVDVFWGIWTLWFNLKTDKYRERFIDAYGRDRIDEDMLRIVAAVEVFG